MSTAGAMVLSLFITVNVGVVLAGLIRGGAEP